MHIVIKRGYCAGKTIKVIKWQYPDPCGEGDYIGYSVDITGRGWQWGTLHSSRNTPESCWEYAVRTLRYSHPRAKISVLDITK